MTKLAPISLAGVDALRELYDEYRVSRKAAQRAALARVDAELSEDRLAIAVRINHLYEHGVPLRVIGQCILKTKDYATIRALVDEGREAENGTSNLG